MRSIGLVMVLVLGACDMGHLGNPVMWPGMIVGGAIENASYDARRKRVSDHVAANYNALIADIRAGGGPTLTKAADLAIVHPTARATMRQDLRNDLGKFTPDSPAARENLVVWIMVHGR